MGAAFDGVLFCPSKFWDAEDRIVLGYISRPFGLSLHVLDNVSFRGLALGPSVKWVEITNSLAPHYAFIKESTRKLSFILLQNLVLTIFMTEMSTS